MVNNHQGNFSTLDQMNIIIVPLECDPTVKSNEPIDGDIIMFLEGVDEMLGMLTSHIPDTEIIHNNR
jgi:hypothetical protein